MTVETLPKINATLNGISTLLLITGFILIRRKMIRAHATVMIIALISSTLFLIGYVTHKAIVRENRSIEVYYPNIPDYWKYIYWFAILIPHLILAIVMLPFIIKGVWHAFRREFGKHRAVMKYTIWVWLYVSVTGVIVYWLLYEYFPLLNERSA